MTIQRWRPTTLRCGPLCGARCTWKSMRRRTCSKTKEVRPGVERAAEGARASGTPFISFFTPTEMLTLARDAGFREVQHVSAATLAERYFAGRTDGLRPPSNSEETLVATT